MADVRDSAIKNMTGNGDWTRHDSGLQVPPEIMLDSCTKDCKVVQWLVEKIRDENEESALMNDFRVQLNYLLDNPSRLGEETFSAELGTCEEIRSQLEMARDKVFHTTVKYSTHSQFDEKALLMIDLSFLPDDFFFSEEHEILWNVYHNFLNPNGSVESTLKTRKLPVTRMRGKLGFYDLGQAGSMTFQFGGPYHWTSFVKNKVLKHFLVHHGCMSPHTELSWGLGFLYTYQQDIQDAHIDYEHGTLEKFCRRHLSAPLPWSMDMPLTKGGMQLQFYGPAHDMTKPQILQIPTKHVILWRGDCVHAGGLWDLLGGPGFRMHGYLNLVEAHESMTNTALRTIEWRDEHGVRYKNYCDRILKQQYIAGLDFSKEELDELYAAYTAPPPPKKLKKNDSGAKQEQHDGRATAITIETNTMPRDEECSCVEDTVMGNASIITIETDSAPRNEESSSEEGTL